MIELIFIALFLYLFALPILINMIPEVKNKESRDEMNIVDKIIGLILVSIVMIALYNSEIKDNGKRDATIAFLEKRSNESKIYMNGALVVNADYVLYRLKRIKKESSGHKGAGHHALDKRVLKFVVEEKGEKVSIILIERAFLGGEYFVYSPDLEEGKGYIGIIRNIFNKPIVLKVGDTIQEFASMDEVMDNLS